jgi:hypothetical protein
MRMARKIFLIYFSLFLSILLCSCKADIQGEIQETNDFSYKISQAEYVDEKIRVLFPQINGMTDAEKEKTINELIKINALKLLDGYEHISSKISVDVDYNIKYNKEPLLSIQYTGVEYIDGAAYPLNIFNTTNIDMESCSKVKLRACSES